MHWAAVTLKGLCEFQNKKILDILEIYMIYFKNVDFKTRDFSLLKKQVLVGVV